jgi:hypothetical protein
MRATLSRLPRRLRDPRDLRDRATLRYRSVVISPDRIARVAGTALRTPVLLRTGNTLVGARCLRPARDVEVWSVHACDLVSTDVDRWSAMLASPCHALVVDEDAGYVATCEQERVLFWDVTTGAPRFREMDGFHARLALPGARLLSLEDVPGQTPDGKQHDEGTRACILDVQRGALAAHFGLHDKVTRVAVDDTATRMIACGRRVVLWDMDARAPLLGFDDDAASNDLTFLPGGTANALRVVMPYHFGSGGPLLLDVKVDALRVEITRIADPRAKERAPLMSFAVSRDGRWLATAHADHIDNHRIEGNAICVWDLMTKELVTDVGVFGETSPYLYAFGERSLRGVYEEWNNRELFGVRW